jgi:hypothetical protein
MNKRYKNSTKQSKFLKSIIGVVLGTFVIVIVVSIIVLITVSFGNLTKYQVENDWIGFFGGFIGAIIGGAVTLIGLFITRQDSLSELEIDRKNSVLPLLNVYQYNGAVNKNILDTAYITDYIFENNRCVKWILVNSEDRVNEQHRIKYEQVMTGDWVNAELMIVNIGAGPVIDLKISTKNFEVIEPFILGKDGIIKMHFYIQIHNIIRDTIFHDCNNIIDFFYKDIYGNEYRQYIAYGVQSEGNNISVIHSVSNQLQIT